MRTCALGISIIIAAIYPPAASAGEVTVFTFRTQTDVGAAVGRVAFAYVEPASPGPEDRPAMHIQFVGGPRARVPGVFLPCRPAGLLPPDITQATQVVLRLYNPGPALLSLVVEFRGKKASYTRHAMLSAGHWRNVRVDPGRVAAAGVDLSSLAGIALRPVRRHAARLNEIFLDRIEFRWKGKAPQLGPIKRLPPSRGPAQALVPKLSTMGAVRWAGLRVPIVADVDVAVAGGGLAGVAAAVAAARRGARTLLVERAGAVGGMATSGYVPPILRPDLAGGLVAEFIDRLQQRGGQQQHRHPEVMKAILLEMLRDAGVRLLLYTTAVAPIMRGNSVTGLIIYSKAGFQAVRARVVIDCTGDADIAARAGAPFQFGRGRDKLTQAATLMFLLGNVDTSKFPGKGRRGGNTAEYVYKARADGWWNIPYSGAAWCEKVVDGPSGVINVNCMNVGGINPLDPADLTYAHVQCFDIIWQLVEFFRRYVPGCENAYLVSSASFIGIRESRRILGEYVLTARDVLSAAVFPDGIARGFFFIDIHPADHTGDASGARLPGPYEIPYRCLVPRRIDNLLVAGRPISADHVAHGSIRVMGTTMALGEAAGVAAALCCKRRVRPRALDGADVRAELTRGGAMPKIGIRVPDNPALATRGTTVTADSYHANYPESAQGAVDGLVVGGFGSRWVSSDAPGPHWLQLHFPRRVSVAAVTLYFWPAGGWGEGIQYVPRQVDVQVRQDGQWVTVGSVEPTGLQARIQLSHPVTTRRLLLWFPRGCRVDNIIRLREVVVTEAPAAEQ